MADRRVPIGSPYDTDRTTQVSCVVSGEEVRDIEEYVFNSDVLSLGDPASVVVGNANGNWTGKLLKGQTFELYMADPGVSGGQRTRRMKGRVIKRSSSTTKDRGRTISLGAADLGWHLQRTPGPLWYKTRGKTWDQMLRDLLDPSWGFEGVSASNLLNRRLNQGRSGQVAAINQVYKAVPPPFQFEAGETIASKIIQYATRERRLLNVSADGTLQLWAPDYDQEVSYKFYLYDDSRRTKTNIKRATLDEDLEGDYTKVTCVGQIVNIAKSNPDEWNPNAGKTRGSYTPEPGTIDFERHLTFSDGDQVTAEMCAKRARWMYERGQFDAWTYTIEVSGHVQNGLFYAPDTMAYVEDTDNGVEGKFYVSSVKYSRKKDQGSVTQLVLKKPNLLSA